MNISLANVNDIEDIMSFINSEWKEGHILARNEAFFRYEHQSGHQVNFVLAKNENNKLVGVLGYINCALYEDSDVSTVIWKVTKSSKNPVLGVQLLQFLQKIKGVRTVCSVGINKKTVGIYKYLGMYTDTLKHFAMINYNIKEFKIAKVKESRGPIDPNNSSIEKNAIKIVKDEAELLKFKFDNFEQNIPYKNVNYFTKRYFQHPIYKYDIFGVYNSGDIAGLFVTRTEIINGARVLRIVDFLGEEKNIRPFALFLSDIIKKEQYEYADFYCFGLDENNLLDSGFQLIDPHNEELIIPNYFNPFLQKNIPIHFFADTKEVNMLRLFKADGDQDRPS
jgi:hypothetical protein